MKISAAIIAFNEERNIARAIESLRCCDEVVVVDSGSSDRTVELAQTHGARVIQSHWRGYAAQKNFAAASCNHDWVLSIDADEALSETLEGEIWELKLADQRFDAYTMPRLAQYLGRWIQHSGWYPDRKVRLYHRRHAQWEGDYVHESVRVTGTVGHLENNLLHYTCSSLSEHLRTLDRYTSLAADELVAQRRPISWRKFTLDPAWTWLKTYVFQQGFRDGFEGLAIANLASLYTFLKYAKAYKQMRPR